MASSEMRRMARSLVEHRSVLYPAPFPREEAETRVKAALEPIRPQRLRLERRWVEGADGLALQTELLPSPRTQRLLQFSSGALAALVGTAAWALYSTQVERTLAFIVTAAAVLWVLGMPLMLAAFGAQREAEEASIARALKRALTDAGEAGAGRSR